MLGFTPKETRILIITAGVLTGAAVIVICISAVIRLSTKRETAFAYETEKTASMDMSDIIVPEEFYQLLPLTWIPLADIDASLPPWLIQKYETNISDLDLDYLRRRTDESIEKTFAGVP